MPVWKAPADVPASRKRTGEDTSDAGLRPVKRRKVAGGAQAERTCCRDVIPRSRIVAARPLELLWGTQDVDVFALAARAAGSLLFV
jgi:hypothetical protein